MIYKKISDAEFVDAKTKKPLDLPVLFWTTPWLILYGSAGSGKTTLAKSMARTWDPPAVISAPEFMLHLKSECRTKEQVGRNIREIIGMPRLVIDDLGYEDPGKFNAMGTEYNPHEIIKDILFARAVNDKLTIMTANIGIENIAQIYDKTDSGRGRLYSRICGLATTVFFKGDRRKKEKVEHSVQSAPDAPATISVIQAPDPAATPSTAEPSDADIIRNLKALRDKPPLERNFHRWLRTTKWAPLIAKTLGKDYDAEENYKKWEDRRVAAAAAGGATPTRTSRGRASDPLLDAFGGEIKGGQR